MMLCYIVSFAPATDQCIERGLGLGPTRPPPKGDTKRGNNYYVCIYTYIMYTHDLSLSLSMYIYIYTHINKYVYIYIYTYVYDV